MVILQYLGSSVSVRKDLVLCLCSNQIGDFEKQNWNEIGEKDTGHDTKDDVDDGDDDNGDDDVGDDDVGDDDVGDDDVADDDVADDDVDSVGQLASSGPISWWGLGAHKTPPVHGPPSI